MRINNIDSQHLINDDFFQFMTQFGDLLGKSDSVKVKVVKQQSLFNTTLAKVESGVRKITASGFTETIGFTDGDRDNSCTGIYENTISFTRHFDPVKSEAARQLAIVWNTYGNKKITKMKINAQTKAVTNLCNTLLSEKYVGYLNTLGQYEWVQKLSEQNKYLDNLMNKRFVETGEISTVVVRDVRRELEIVFGDICEIVNALVKMEGEEDYKSFINTLNAMIKKYDSGSRAATAQPETSDNIPATPTEPEEEPATPTEPVIEEETHEEKMAKARAFTTINEGEWKNGDYCWHLVNSVKTYWKLLDAAQKTVKPYLSGGEAVWEKVS